MKAEARLTIVLDGTPHPLPVGTTLAALVAELGHAPDVVATAVNGRFIPRERRDTHALNEGDAVSLFQPIVGG